MIRSNYSILIIGTVIFSLLGFELVHGQKERIILKGDYFGQKKPGIKPEIFAEDFQSRLFKIHSSPVFSPDGKEVFFSVFFNRRYSETIMFMEQIEGGIWTEPMPASFSGTYFEGGPAFTPDGNQIFFGSNRTLTNDGTNKDDRDIWYVEKAGNTWGDPKRFKHSTDVVDEHMSFSDNGNMYFRSGRDLYLSRFINNDYTKPVALCDSINTPDHTEIDVCIAPDESYLVFCSSRRPDRIGENDLYISFNYRNGNWSRAVNLGEDINWIDDETRGTRFPKLSPDGRYFFFTKITKRGEAGLKDVVFWVDAIIFDKYTLEGIKTR